MNGFDQELPAEAFDVPVEVVRKMQKENNQGLLVKCKERMNLVPQEEEEEERMRYDMKQNGVEETICTMRIKENMENEADFVSRQAGRINNVHQQKLPILQYLDMSAERGYLKPVSSVYRPGYYKMEWCFSLTSSII